MAWTLLDLRNDLPKAYEEATKPGAHEWLASVLWRRIVVCVAQGYDYAVEINDQTPPDEAPGAESRLRRVDFKLIAFDRDRKDTKNRPLEFTILFVEVKKHNASIGDYELVVSQAYSACESYTLSPNTHSNLVWALATVGATWRWYVRQGNSYGPVWGSQDVRKEDWKQI